MHKKIGILGGLAPESTAYYYQRIVRRYQEQYGDHNFPVIIIYSVSFQEYEDWMYSGDWDKIKEGLLESLMHLTAAGADFAIMATNTMHIHIDELKEMSPIPILSIVDATAEEIKEEGFKTVGLLGTRFTMEKDFYKKGLAKHGIKTLVPDRRGIGTINQIIYNELTRGKINPESRKKYLDIIDDLIERGAEGIVLGCTEIPLLVTPEFTRVKLFDTSAIHSEKALEYALET